MYAAGREHPHRLPAQRLILSIVDGSVLTCTDAEVLQEILYRYWHVGQRQHGMRVFDLFLKVKEGSVLAVDDEVLARAGTPADAYPTLPPRDLVHLAVMKRHQLTVIASADSHFDGLEGVRRLPPDRWQ
jgi:predicted nucleic acid-binding protein